MIPQSTIHAGPVWAGPLGHWTQGRAWRVGLLHKAELSMILQVTRGQGRLLLHGARHGLNANAVVYIPEGTVFACDMSQKSAARMMAFAPVADFRMPRRPALMRLREVGMIRSFAHCIETAMQEASGQDAFVQDALKGHAQLMIVWLMRALATDAEERAPLTAARRLAHRFFEQLGAKGPGPCLLYTSDAADD